MDRAKLLQNFGVCDIPPEYGERIFTTCGMKNLYAEVNTPTPSVSVEAEPKWDKARKTKNRSSMIFIGDSSIQNKYTFVKSNVHARNALM